MKGHSLLKYIIIAVSCRKWGKQWKYQWW